MTTTNNNNSTTNNNNNSNMENQIMNQYEVALKLSNSIELKEKVVILLKSKLEGINALEAAVIKAEAEAKKVVSNLEKRLKSLEKEEATLKAELEQKDVIGLLNRLAEAEKIKNLDSPSNSVDVMHSFYSNEMYFPEEYPSVEEEIDILREQYDYSNNGNNNHNDNGHVETVINNISNSVNNTVLEKFNSPLEYFCHHSKLAVEDYPNEGERLTDEQFNRAFTNWTTSREICLRPEVPIAELSDREVMALFSWQNNNLLEVAYNFHEELYTKKQYDILSLETVIRLHLVEEGAANIDDIRKHLINCPIALVSTEEVAAFVRSQWEAVMTGSKMTYLKDTTNTSKDNTDTSIDTTIDVDVEVKSDFSGLEEFPTILNYCLLKESDEEEVTCSLESPEVKETSLIDSQETTVVEQDATKVKLDFVPITDEDFIKVTGQSRPKTKREFTALIKNQDVLQEYLGTLTEKQIEEFCTLNDDIISKGTKEKYLLPVKETVSSTWYKATLKDALDASDCCFDQDCLSFLEDYLGAVGINDTYTSAMHTTLVTTFTSIVSTKIEEDCIQFIDYGLRFYFQPETAVDLFTEEQFDKVATYLREKYNKES